jgi:hypothetical protein
MKAVLLLNPSTEIVETFAVNEIKTYIVTTHYLEHEMYAERLACIKANAFYYSFIDLDSKNSIEQIKADLRGKNFDYDYLYGWYDETRIFRRIFEGVFSFSNSLETYDKLADKLSIRIDAQTVGPIHYFTNPAEWDSTKQYIAKPMISQSSIGIEMYNPQRTYSDYIVEEFIPGQEFSCETISYSGTHEILSVTKKISTDEITFVEQGGHINQQITEEVRALVGKQMSLYLNQLGVENGFCHIEFKIHNGQLIIIDPHLRRGGFVAQMTDRLYERNCIQMLIDSYRAGKLTLSPMKPHTESILFGKVQADGELLSVTDKNHKSSDLKFNCLLKAGQKIPQITSNLERHMYALIQSKSEIESGEMMKNYLSNVSIQLETTVVSPELVSGA